MRPIDLVVVREKRQRLTRQENQRRSAERALEALSWFGEYAMEVTSGVQKVNADALIGGSSLGSRDVPALLVASATPGVKTAEEFVRRAFLSLRPQIIALAIDLAQVDLDAAEKELEK